MQKSLLIVVSMAVLAGLFSSPSMASSKSDSEPAIRDLIAIYFKAHATGDANPLRQIFLPSARVDGMPGGKFRSVTVEQYIQLFNGKPAADEASRVRTIDQIDVSGDAATVKATLNYGGVAVVDYFILLRIDGAWKVANKVYGRLMSGTSPSATE